MKDKRLISRLLIAAFVALIAAAAAYRMLSSPKEEPASSSASAIVEPSGPLWGDNPFAKGESRSPLPSYAQSVTANTGVFTVNEKGELILDSSTKVRLDILVTGLPQNPTGHELEAAKTSAIAGLLQNTAQKAVLILDNYLRYSKAEAELNTGFANENGAPPEKMLDQLIALRRQQLGAQVADALFAVQEAQDRYGIQVAALEADQKLTPRERIARIDALQRALPKADANFDPELVVSRSALMMEERVAALRRQGASEALIRQLREKQLGAEGAESIGEMEQQKRRWESRQQEFVQRKNVIAQMNLSEPQKQERIEELLHQLYTEEEVPAARAFQ